MISPNTFDPTFWKSLSEPFPLFAHSTMASPMRFRSSLDSLSGGIFLQTYSSAAVILAIVFDPSSSAFAHPPSLAKSSSSHTERVGIGKRLCFKERRKQNYWTLFQHHSLQLPPRRAPKKACPRCSARNFILRPEGCHISDAKTCIEARYQVLESARPRTISQETLE